MSQSFQFKKNTRSAFTLIELLVVIAIIGILAAIILASLSGARAGAKDAKIVEEMLSIRNELAINYDSTSGLYPNISYWWQNVAYPCDGVSDQANPCVNTSGKKIRNIINDIVANTSKPGQNCNDPSNCIATNGGVDPQVVFLVYNTALRASPSEWALYIRTNTGYPKNYTCIDSAGHMIKIGQGSFSAPATLPLVSYPTDANGNPTCI